MTKQGTHPQLDSPAITPLSHNNLPKKRNLHLSNQNQQLHPLSQPSHNSLPSRHSLPSQHSQLSLLNQHNQLSLPNLPWLKS